MNILSLFDEKYNEIYCGKLPCLILKKDATHVLIKFESGTKIATTINSLNKDYGKKHANKPI